MKESYKILNDFRGMSADRIVNKILESREIKNINDFLNPTKKYLLPFEMMKNIDMARNIVIQGLKNKKRFLVFFDTDLDGTSAGAIIFRYLKHYTDKVDWIINKGKAHGLLGQKIKKFLSTDILIIVDSLDSEITAYKELYEKGIKIIVLDHHEIRKDLVYENYVALVSSANYYDNPALSGSGVTWKFCKYIDEYYGSNYADEYVDLATCGIIGDMCDVSENSMENRYICHLGLSNLINTGIKRMIGSYPFISSAISYNIAPLINAAHRMRLNELAVKLFLTDDKTDAKKYVNDLKDCRIYQNKIVDSLMEEVIRQAEEQENQKLIYVFIKNEADVSGLLGNKLIAIYKKPVLVLRNKNENGVQIFRGSARAVGLNDFRTICNETGLCKAMGHPLAHGVYILKDDFVTFLEIMKDKLKDIEFETKITIDAEISLYNINRGLIDKIKEIDRISGKGFRPVVVRVSDVSSYDIGNMSQGKHLTVKPNDKFMFIHWNWNGNFEVMEENSLMEEPLSFVGTLDSGWFGRKFYLKMICSEIKGGV